MAYYTALITAWTTTPQPPIGVSGSGTSTTATGLSSTMTTQQKLDTVNNWTVIGTIPTSTTVSGSQLANCVNWTEFATLDSTQQRRLLDLFNTSGLLIGGSANTSLLPVGMILASFPSSGATVANLTALAKGIVTPWWQANSYTAPISLGDLGAAGLN